MVHIVHNFTQLLHSFTQRICSVSPPLFWVGDGLYKYPPPPLFEDKITLNLTFIVKKLTFLTVKLLKTPKIARSHTNVLCMRLDLCGFASIHVFFSWHHFCKERCRIKQYYVTLWLGIAGLLIIQVKGTWRSQGRIILAQKLPITKEWNSPLKYCTCSFLCAQSTHLCISNNTSEIWYFTLPAWCKQC